MKMLNDVFCQTATALLVLLASVCTSVAATTNTDGTTVATAAIVTSTSTTLADEQLDGSQLYQQHCQRCHGVGRMGGIGPALFPENLARLRATQASDVIKHGRAATQMPAFSGQLSNSQIAQLVRYIYAAPAAMPSWDIADIKASKLQHVVQATLPNTPQFEADLMNLFIVVELGDHSATLLNGDTFAAITRFKTRFALHGGPKYSPDGRFVYFASRDGWISKYDIYNLKTVAEVRAGINTRNMAISSDGKYAIVGNYLPHNVVILDTRTLLPLKLIATSDNNGTSSRVSAVYNAPPRASFIVALKDVKEVWEIPYSDAGGVELLKGWADDHRKDAGEEAIANWRAEDFPIRRIPTEDYLDDFFFDPDYIHLIGASRDSQNGQVINLDVKKKVATINISGMPHLGSGITWDYQGRQVFASPNIQAGLVTVIDMENWQVIKEIKTEGPGFFMRSHSNSPYAWVDVFFGPNKDKVHVIRKATLEIVKTLTPAPGKTAAHVEFTKDGNYVLLSIWDEDGAVIVYDANTLEEIKRIPMKKPSGKYNVHNKIEYERGTSH